MSTDTIKKARTPSLTLAEKHQAMTLIEKADDSKPDADLAADIGAALGRPVAPSIVTAYRKALGLEPVKQPSRAELKRRLDEAMDKLIAERQARLKLAGGGQADDVLPAGATLEGVSTGKTDEWAETEEPVEAAP